MATSFSNMEFDPTTGQTKPKQNLPYLNPNEASQGYLPAVNYSQQNLQQGNANVMGTAQQAAMQNPQSGQMQDQTTKMTQKLMTDPNMGRDWAKYNTAAMSKFDADRAASTQAFKQQNAGMGGAGQVQDNLIKMALQQNFDRGVLENELENQAYEEGMKNYLSALGQGREQGQYLDDSQTKYINNLLNVRGAYEGERSQDSAQDFTTSEREATQAWQTGERISVQDYNSYEADLNRKQQLAMQNNDIVAQKDIENSRNMLQLQMQTQGFNQEEKMAYLNDQLATARANGDVTRQKQIIEFQTTQDISRMKEQFGLDVAKAEIDNRLAMALQNNDAANSQVLMQYKWDMESEQRLQDNAFKQATLKLEERGIDLRQIENQYNMLQSAVQAGQIDPSAAVDFLKQKVGSLGIQVTALDAMDQTKKALKAEFESQQYQWALTHANDSELVDANGDLTAKGLQQFNEFFNKTVYGEGGTGSATLQNIIDGTASAASVRGGKDPNSANAPAYQQLLNSAPEWSPSVSKDSRGFWSPDVRKINNAPAVGEVFKYGGNVYKVTSGVSEEKKGQNYQYFTVIDLNTGETRTISANSNGNGINGFQNTTSTSSSASNPAQNINVPSTSPVYSFPSTVTMPR